MIFRATILSVLLMAVAAFAQFQITSNDIPPFNTTTTTGTQNAATFNAGSGGADQSWTFTQNAWDNVMVTTYMDPATTPSASNFPTATLALRTVEDTTTTYLYFRVTDDSYQLLGVSTPALDTLFSYDAAVNVLSLPVGYNSNWTTVLRVTAEIMPGFSMSMVDSSVCTVDGWGTVNTPYVTDQPALRLFQSHTQTTTTPFSTDTYTYMNYTWLNMHGIDLVSVTSEDDETNVNFTTGSLSMLGVPSAAEPVRGPVANSFAVGQNYPNPFNPSTTLPVELSKTSRVQLDIYDETGRQVSSRAYDLAAGQHNLTVDGSAWATGTYFARVNAEGLSQTTKMQLVK